MNPEQKRTLLRKNLGLLLTVLIMVAVLLPLGLWAQSLMGQLAFYLVLAFGMGILFKPVYNFFARKFGYETVEEYLASKQSSQKKKS